MTSNKSDQNLLKFICLIFAINFLLGKISLLLAIPPGYSTAIWPPAGIALSAFLIWGNRMGFAVGLASFLLNISIAYDPTSVLSISRSIYIALGIGLGSTLQGFIGAKIIKRFIGYPTPLIKLKDILLFFILGGPITCLISATFGLCILATSGIEITGNFSSIWFTWWIGDTIGVAIFAPMLLLWKGEPREVWRSRRKSMFISLTGCLVVVSIAFISISRLELTREQNKFLTFAEEQTSQIQKNLSIYEEILYSIRSFFLASKEITRAEFKKFTEEYFLRNPGIQALKWIPQVTDDQRQQMEEFIQKEGYPDFEFTEQTVNGKFVRREKAETYYPVVFLEPFAENKFVFGFDLASSPARFAALKKARDTRQSVATGKINLIQENQSGVLIFLPVYKNDLPQTKDTLVGFILGVFRINNIIEHSLPKSIHNLTQIDLFDTTDNKKTLLYSNAEILDSLERKRNLSFLWEDKFQIGTREWTIQFTPTYNFMKNSGDLSPWLILSSGLLLTSVIGMYILTITAQSTIIKQEVGLKTQELMDLNIKLDQARQLAETSALISTSTLQARFEAVFENAPSGILVVDSEAKIQMVNILLEQMLGYSREELLGQSLELLLPEANRGNHIELRNNYIKNPTTRLMGAGRNLFAQRKDGSLVPVEIGLSPIKTTHGLSVLATVIDITQRQQIQDELVRSNSELEQFAYVASHDLKAPLRAIKNYAQWLTDDAYDHIPEASKVHLTKIMTRIKGMEQLLDDLLTYSRIGKENQETTIIDTAILLPNIVDLLSPPDTIDIKISPQLPVISSAKAPLELVFRNLIGNAIKFHNKNPGHISISAKDLGEFYQFTVIDDGPGIPKRFHDKVFQMFQTLQPKDNALGTGMGLAIVKKIVEESGGSITLDSEEGKGAAFTFTWPSLKEKI